MNYRTENLGRVVTCGIFLIAIGLSLTDSSDAADARGARPNVIVILADDLGRGDYSAFGTKDIATPAIDRLCREGMSFRNFYASCCVCSPTRAALMTGCFPDRVGVPGVIRHVPDDSWGWLSADAVLLPQILRPKGYHSAIIGKWHLGLESPNTPTERGFDFFHGFLGDMMDDYVTHRRGGHNFMRRNLEEIDPPGHATDLFTQWACEYITERAANQKATSTPSPFFLYLAYNAPHDPIQPKVEWLDKVKAREPTMSDRRAGLVALIEHMDDGISQVLRTLDSAGIAENTLVVFTSDNGGVLRNEANNGPWRSDKQHMYEGGLRVPGVVRWPAHVRAGTTSDRVVVTMDLFSTIAEAAGAAVPSNVDGFSFLSTVTGEENAEELANRELYFVRREGGPAYGGKTIEALIRGDWKLVQDSPFAPLELFHLRTDPREEKNLATQERKVFLEMSAALRRHVQEGGQTQWQKPVRRPSTTERK